MSGSATKIGKERRNGIKENVFERVCVCLCVCIAIDHEEEWEQENHYVWLSMLVLSLNMIEFVFVPE